MNSRIWRVWQKKCRRQVLLARSAFQDPVEAQRELLDHLCSSLQGTRYVSAHGIDLSRHSREAFHDLPLMTAEDLDPWVQRIQEGEPQVLTCEPVEQLVPTSGSTGPSKRIPLTASGRRAIADAMRIWMGDLMLGQKSPFRGKAYVATSPAMDMDQQGSRVHIGFANDAAYLHRFERTWLPHLLAVPFSVASLRKEAWRQAVRDAFWRCEDLELISIWHPSYLRALFTPEEWEQLPGRWPGLQMISCWADGVCAPAAKEFHALFPDAVLQPKGLWLTEGVVSLPFEGTHPLAVTSCYLEFQRPDGALVPVPELEVGERVRPVITNGFGLTRYLLGDEVEVTGRLYQTPTVRWLGRADRVSDLCGEKLSEAQVEVALRAAGASAEAKLQANPDLFPPCYHLQGTGDLEKLERALTCNPHYAWARELNQLGPVRQGPPESRVQPAAFGHWKDSRLSNGGYKPESTL